MAVPFTEAGDTQEWAGEGAECRFGHKELRKGEISSMRTRMGSEARSGLELREAGWAW